MPVEKVIIAFGCQVRDWNDCSDVTTLLDGHASVTKVSASPLRYRYKKGKRKIDIDLVFEKAAFRKALDAGGAVVVYDGHSRYGQGPAFCGSGFKICKDPPNSASNPMGDHFRMGWDAVNVPCIEEILHHCVAPSEYPETPPKTFFARAWVRNVFKLAARPIAKKTAATCGTIRFARRSLASCKPAIARLTNGLGERTLATRHYWYTIKRGADFETMVKVGSGDLDATGLACGALFVNSCSSKRHFYAALRRKRIAVKGKTRFLLTTRPASASTTHVFLQLVLRGLDPRKAKDAKKICRRLNAIPGSGRVVTLK
ncbi:MAG: hypothetical protein JW876_07220 [Candidatus Krumholzibacteriota bacterium]|nr:hypothetical protein [Candidatus Krumholzibacteriota bacterium]